MSHLAALRHLSFQVLAALAAILFLVEDFLVRRLGRLLGWFTRWPFVARLEAWAARLPPYGALTLFLVPSALILPEKLLAVWFFTHRRYWLGIATLVAAKLFASAIVGRILSVCYPTLLRLGWFRRTDLWVHETRARIDAIIAASAVGRAIAAGRQRLAQTMTVLDRFRVRGQTPPPKAPTA